MAVMKCMFCGNRMYYHGEPEDNIPMAHYFCTSDKWSELIAKVPSSYELPDYWKEFIESWKCKRCGTFTFFVNVVHVAGVYAPIENFSSAPMQEPFEFGPFWNDFQWFDNTGIFKFRQRLPLPQCRLKPSKRCLRIGTTLNLPITVSTTTLCAKKTTQ